MNSFDVFVIKGFTVYDLYAMIKSGVIIKEYPRGRKLILRSAENGFNA